MTMDPFNYGNAMRGRPRLMALTRQNVRDLVLTTIRNRQGASPRSEAFTDEEVDSIIDAYMAANSGSNGLVAIIDKMRELEALPWVSQSRQAHLAKLRSVSPAYRRSQIPSQFRSKERTSHDDRQSTQAPHGNPNASSYSQDARDPAFLAQRLQHYAQQATTSIIPNAYLVHAQHAAVLAAANARGLVLPGTIANIPPGAMAYMGGNLWSSPLADPEPEPPLPTEIKPGEIIAWRAWKVEGSPMGLILSSVSAMSIWAPGRPMTGDIKNGLGVHAWKTEALAQKHYASGYNVIGEVELWGQVVEHEEGYRAECGAIKSLHLPKGSSVTRQQLADLRLRYGTGQPTTVPLLKRGKEWVTGPILGCVVGASCFALAAATLSPIPIIAATVIGVLFVFAALTASEG